MIEERSRQEVANVPANIPIFGDKPTKPGIWLGLFYGRDTPGLLVNDLGFDGPQFGPLKYVGSTCASSLRLQFRTTEDSRPYREVVEVNEGDWCELNIENGMVVLRGKYYIDWAIFYQGKPKVEEPPF